MLILDQSSRTESHEMRLPLCELPWATTQLMNSWELFRITLISAYACRLLHDFKDLCEHVSLDDGPKFFFF